MLSGAFSRYVPLTEESQGSQRVASVQRSAGSELKASGDDHAVDSPLHSDPVPIESSTHGKPELEFKGVDIVQFSSPMYFADSGEGHLGIDIMRLGSMRGEVRVKWQTEDGSATAGSRYIAASGEAVFADGVSNVAIEIEIVPSKKWSATMEFKVQLSDPSSNCELGFYLKTCRIKLMDGRMFPSDKYKDLLVNMDMHKEFPASWGLVWEYMKLNFQVDGMAWRTLVVLMGDQLENLYLLMTLFLNVYLVDVVMNTEDEDTEERLLFPSREHTAYAIGLAYILPRIVIHCWEISKFNLAVVGKSRTFLQTSLFRKYMNFSEESRQKASAITVALLKDCPEVAVMYMKLLGISGQIWRLIILQGFMLHSNSSSWWVLILMPTLMFVYGYVLLRKIDEVAPVRVEQTLEFATMVTEVQKNYELIADYSQRPQMNQAFGQKVADLNAAIGKEAVRILHYTMCPQYLGPAFSGAWIGYCSRLVIRGEVSLGELLAMVTVFGKVAMDFGMLYATVLEVKTIMVIMQHLTRLFNLQTDVPLMKSVNRTRRAVTKAAREKALSTSRGADVKCPVTDTLTLSMRDLDFKYMLQHQLLLHSIKVAAHQASLVAVFGENGAGRQTLLRILALKLFPNAGIVFIPTHLRILHVSLEPYILRRSAFENLTFACPDAEPKRIREIIKMLDMPETLGAIEQDLRRLKDGSLELGFTTEKQLWIDALSDSERMKLHLARALIMNPEVMVLQRPFRRFHDKQWRKVMQVIRRHVTERGIHMPVESRGRRRPRTVFFSADVEEQTHEADVIWQIKPDKSVEMLLPARKAEQAE